MKRSEINTILREAKAFFAQQKFHLPQWAEWRPEQWQGAYAQCHEIIDNMLGWDITDFASNDFKQRGLVLFNLRNGNSQKKDKIYCEKIMIVEEGQETPLHFHWNKTEDIINRGGGVLVLELFVADAQEQITQEAVTVRVDGMEIQVEAGQPLCLNPGSSICLKPGCYHRFYGKKGGGKVLVGEVSMVNDDENDNRFHETLGRFPEIEEDEPALHLLVNDYPKYL